MQGRSHISQRVGQHVQERLGAYGLAVLILLLGIALGSMAVSILSPSQKADLLKYLGGYLSHLGSGQGSGPSLMRVALSTNLKALLIFSLLGVSIIGLPVMCLMLFLRGFVVGFTTGFITGELGSKGLFVLLAGVAPANLLLLPAFLMTAAAAFGYTGLVIRSRMRFKGGLPAALTAYGGLCAVSGALVLVGSLIEAYFTPLLLGAIWPYLGH